MNTFELWDRSRQARGKKPPVNNMENNLERLEQNTGKKLEGITVKSAKTIMSDLTDSVLDVVLQKLIEKERKIAKLLLIPELKSLVLKRAIFEWGDIGLFFELSDFTENLRQLLLKNGYKRNSLGTRKDGITIHLYWSSLIINIKQVVKKNP